MASVDRRSLGDEVVVSYPVVLFPVLFYHNALPAPITYAYPKDQNVSIFLPVSSSIYGNASLNVTLWPWISAICPVNEASDTSCCTPFVRVDIGVSTICLNKSLLGAMLVSAKHEQGPRSTL